MKKVILFLTLILCLSACSRIDLAVYFADTYVQKKADEYFDLTRDQSKWLKKALKSDIDKVKKTIFPQLAAELIRNADIVNSQRSFDVATVQLSYERVRNLFYDGLRIFSPEAVAFSGKLEPSQVNVFQKEFDKKMRDIKEDASERESYKRMKKHLDSWLGGLTSAQKKELESYVHNTPSHVNEKVYNRQLLAHEFVRSFPDLNARGKFVEGIFTRYESMREPAYSKLTNEKDREVIALVTSILNKMTDSQRETLIETLRDRANQLIKLSKN
nr:DUF6279 family lipoprotein [Bacteriovorax sp. HI3]